MKTKLISALVSIIMALSLVPASYAETGGSSSSSGHTPARGGGGGGYDETEKFYYSADGKEVTVSLDGAVEFENTDEKNIILACYDGAALVKTEVLPLAAAVNGGEINDLVIELAKEPADLSVKAFAWSAFNTCTPLCDAAELSDVPQSAVRVLGRVDKTSRSDSGLDKDEVEMYVLLKEDFDEEFIENGPYVMRKGSTDIDRHIGELVDAYITVDDNDEYTVLKYNAPGGQTVTIAKPDVAFPVSGDTISTTDNDEYQLSDELNCYVNGVYCSTERNQTVSIINDVLQNAPDKYNKITLLDTFDTDSMEGDGVYDTVIIDCYYSAVIDDINHTDDFDAILFSESDFQGTSLKYYFDDNPCTFRNEKMEECDISELYKFIGKEIYIAYDIQDNYKYSDFYDIILEGAKSVSVEHKNELNDVHSAVVVRYSDTDKTAMLDGEITVDGDGNLPFTITVDFIKDNRSLKTEEIKTSTAFRKLTFGYEEGTGIDYTFTGKELPLDQKPDKAVISFGDNEMAGITVPVVDENAFKVFGRVTQTGRTSGDIDDDKVEFSVERSDNFDGNEIIADYGAEDIIAFAGNTNAVNMLLEYSMAYISKISDNSYIIEAIVPRAASKSVVLAAENFDDAKSSEGALYFFEDGTSRSAVKYSLDYDYTVYINGVPSEDLSGYFDMLCHYIAERAAGTVTLSKVSEMGSTSTSSNYNLVMINDYATAFVSGVNQSAGGTVLNFSVNSQEIEGDTMTIGNEAVYNITLNGERIRAADISQKDVLSIAYDMGAGFANSSFYDIIVSRNTVTGTCTSVTGDGIYTVNNNKYKVVFGMDAEIYPGTDYKLYLDAFGKIAWAEENEAANNLAILDMFICREAETGLPQL